MLLSRTCFGSDKEFCKMLSLAGYKAVDLNDTTNTDLFHKSEYEYMSFLENAIKNVFDAGLIIGQCHAPHTGTYWNSTSEDIEYRIVAIENCIKAANKLDIPYTVVHPLVYAFNKPDNDFVKNWKMNVDILRRISPYAKGTVLCLENMPGVGGVIRSGEDMSKMLSDVGNNSLMVCFDTGHLISQEIKSSDFFAAVGDKIKVLHIHDSIKDQDLHLLAGTGNGDWDDFKNTLKQYDYQGNINSESVFVYKTPKELQLEGQILECKILNNFITKNDFLRGVSFEKRA